MHPLWMSQHDPYTMFCAAPESCLTESTAIASSWVTTQQDQTSYKLFQMQHHSQPPAKTQQDLLQLPKHRLITDVVTKWNSSHDIRFLEQLAIYAALLSTEVRKSEKDVFTPNETDITCAEEVLKALKPMKNATLVMPLVISHSVMGNNKRSSYECNYSLL